MTEAEELDLDCPLCPDSHIYFLEVKRNFVIAFSTPGITSSPERVRFTKVFRCPKKEKDFKASFTLIQFDLAEITSVSVTGVKNEK
ncbi:MAG: hypothetical protein ACE5OZ_25245 [Candidatus Heimdallarchaeota archaeon]